MKRLALGIIDAQRGFMPANEGIRLNLPGFGELPVERGELIVPNINKLFKAYEILEHTIFTTQDWHPGVTAHFSEQPNFTTTWPIHCVGGTPGAELHPAIAIPRSTERFRKGMEVLKRGEDDQSYSGNNGINDKGIQLGKRLLELGVTEVTLGGLALDYCVGKTALDLRRMDFDVVIAIDATSGIAEESVNSMLKQFNEHDIKITSTDEILVQMETA